MKSVPFGNTTRWSISQGVCCETNRSSALGHDGSVVWVNQIQEGLEGAAEILRTHAQQAA
jgi:hypothetical protein